MMKCFKSWVLVLSTVLCIHQLAAANFKFDIFINGAENPSLSFGVGEAVDQLPAPPFSGMFGVIDVHLLNTDSATKAVKWFDRLSTDIKTEENAAAQGWMVYAKNNATLKFALKEGTADNLMISYQKKPGQIDSLVEEQLDDNYSLSVKTGGYYMIYSGQKPAEENLPKAENVVLVPPKKKNTPAERIITIPAGTNSIIINFNAGTGIIGYKGQSDITADWIIQLIRSGFDTTYEWLTENTRLKVTFTPTGRNVRAAGEEQITMKMQSMKNSVPPVTTEIEIPAADQSQTPQIVDAADWILPFFGTLDFDGDGFVTLDDATYFYNLINNISDNQTSIPDWIESSMLMDYTENATPEKAEKALQFFRENLDATNFDEDTGVTLDDATYLYNLINNISDNQTSIPDWIESNMLLDYTENADSGKADKALEQFKNLINQ